MCTNNVVIWFSLLSRICSTYSWQCSYHCCLHFFIGLFWICLQLLFTLFPSYIDTYCLPQRTHQQQFTHYPKSRSNHLSWLSSASILGVDSINRKAKSLHNDTDKSISAEVECAIGRTNRNNIDCQINKIWFLCFLEVARQTIE